MQRQDRPPLRNRPANTPNVEALLRDLQNDIEQFGTERTKQRRRAILRGFRAGLWTMADKPKLGDVAMALRCELFGHTLPVVTEDDDIRCHSGTSTEGE